MARQSPPSPGPQVVRARYMGQQISTTLEWTPTEHLTLGGTYVSYMPGERIKQAGGTSGSFAAGWATISF
jgi:hypothetical protein